MIKLARRWWAYLTAKLTKGFNEKADPSVQLEQAIREAQQQHKELKEQAANVIAQQKQSELQLNRKLDEYEKLNANARQAVLMADEAMTSGDEAKTAQYTRAAEAFANKLINLEGEMETLKTMSLASSQAADQAKAAVRNNSQALQKRLAEKNRLAGQLEQAKMQEQMNKTMASLSETIGEDVPTLNEVRDKIEARYAKAKGTSELNEESVETQMIEIESAAANVEANARLSEIRAQLGLEAPAAASEPAAVDTGETAAG